MSDTEAAAEWLYEQHWSSRRWPSEEKMRPRPTFTQLMTGETCLPPSYAHTEVAEAKQWLALADSLLAAIRPLIEAEVREGIE